MKMYLCRGGVKNQPKRGRHLFGFVPVDGEYKGCNVVDIGGGEVLMMMVLNLEIGKHNRLAAKKLVIISLVCFQVN